MVLGDSQQTRAAEQHRVSKCSFSIPRGRLYLTLLPLVSREKKTQTKATAEALMVSLCQAGDGKSSEERTEPETGKNAIGKQMRRRRIALEVCPCAFSTQICPARFLLRKHWEPIILQESVTPCKILLIGRPLIHSFFPKRGTCSSVGRVDIKFKLSVVFLKSVILGIMSLQKRNAALVYIFFSSSHVHHPWRW